MFEKNVTFFMELFSKELIPYNYIFYTYLLKEKKHFYFKSRSSLLQCHEVSGIEIPYSSSRKES